MSLLFTNILSAEIREIHEVSDGLEAISSVRCSDWALFDIDYTLTAPDHPMLQMALIKQNKKLFREELEKFVGDEKKLVPALMVTEAPSKLLEVEAPLLIKKLITLNVTVFGFTAIDTSSIPNIGEVPVWRLKELERLGIRFSNHTNSCLPANKIEFTQFPAFRGTYPLYDQGVLYANVIASKGAVLRAFIENSALKPARVILIDDSLENLQTMQQELEQLNIPFIGLHYVPKDCCAIEFSEKQWRGVWDSIKKRAEKASFVGHDEETTLQPSVKTK